MNVFAALECRQAEFTLATSAPVKHCCPSLEDGKGMLIVDHMLRGTISDTIHSRSPVF